LQLRRREKKRKVKMMGLRMVNPKDGRGKEEKK
jgi:hypothetical protein